MKEAKVAAYYDELTRCGEGAARFKQDPSFSSASTDSKKTPACGSALPYLSSSFLNKLWEGVNRLRDCTRTFLWMGLHLRSNGLLLFKSSSTNSKGMPFVFKASSTLFV
ncbi:putative ATP-dependent RNA helicase DDX46 [Prunus yedoensis var. nudiflora]|uniref:Putative ATP-dependent RNA helicase DDX46 n=1 Tax=Prunus yedoensis var. nudiflora TaxID=2094558 RepID=A0A314Z7Y3_PRUYE|nr:putative ATP-dependent RNA helicase DDX46 [Prunus yedoensis var. nudiflora]